MCWTRPSGTCYFEPGTEQADDGRTGAAGLPGPPPAARTRWCSCKRPQDVVYDQTMPGEAGRDAADLDSKRIAAVQKFLTAQTERQLCFPGGAARSGGTVSALDRDV